MLTAARTTDTIAAWLALAATLRAKATATPKTQDERDVANVAAYCDHRAMTRQRRIAR